MIHAPIHADHNRRGKQAESVSTLMHIEAYCIEGMAHVDPVRWSDHPFIAESKHLASNNNVRPAFFGTAGLNISLANIKGVLIRHGIGNLLIEKDARVLHPAEEGEPFQWLNRQVES
jgi:hypothetical protein